MDEKEQDEENKLSFPLNKTGCPNCGAPPSEHEVRNYSLIWHDGDVYCTKCGAYVRMFDAG